MEKFFVIMVIFAGLIPLAFGEVAIHNDQQYVGDDGARHIVGEIRNNLESPLNQVNIHVTLFDENRHAISTEETASLVNTIMPGMKAPFDLILTGNKARDTRSYSLELDYNISYPKNQVIDIIESEMSRDEYDNLIITGVVTNKGDITANTVAVIATLYDRRGDVAIVSRIHPEPDYLRAGDKTFFVVATLDKAQTGGIVDYTLIAESEEYAAVPEFPIGVMVLMAGALSVYVGIVRYSNRVITDLIFATDQK